jgi:hypothetical protein
LTTKKPTLADLGLDEPSEKSPFGNAFDNYDSSKEDQPKTWVDSVNLGKPAEKSGVAAVLSFIIPGAGQVLRGRIVSGFISLVLIGGLYGTTLAFFPAFLLAFPLHLLNVYMAYSE